MPVPTCVHSLVHLHACDHVHHVIPARFRSTGGGSEVLFFYSANRPQTFYTCWHHRRHHASQFAYFSDALCIFYDFKFFVFFPCYRMYWTALSSLGEVQNRHGDPLELQWGILNRSQSNMLQLEMKIVGKNTTSVISCLPLNANMLSSSVCS